MNRDMLYKTSYKSLWLLAVAIAFSACSQDDIMFGDKQANEGDVINVGVDTDILTMTSSITRASAERTDAEKVSWLVQPLKQGLDITYGKVGDDSSERVAILKLLPADNGSVTDDTYKTNGVYAEYSFNYRSTDGTETSEKACWHGNGPHYFEGVHVPNRLRYNSEVSELATNNRKLPWSTEELAAVTNLTSDQSGDNNIGTDNALGNYTLLSHYLGMPANTQISATVARIKLPFRHRLSRVLAYILIDPELKTNNQYAKIKGYANIESGDDKPFKDDPATSSIRFCNVDVLEGVHDVYNSETKLHTLTPKWYKVRKAIPHFCEQKENFVIYENGKNTVYPNNDNYAEVAAAYNANPTTSGYVKREYPVVPVYDLIVRPTYTSLSNVMYDENGYDNETTRRELANNTNTIEFIVTLDDELTYQKKFEFDLNANYQTIVYLKISPEGVDYNDSDSEIWKETKNTDNWFGLDNANGNTLSEAGSSWQRAFYNNYLPGEDKVTDGGFYSENTNGKDNTVGQYLSEATWKNYFLQAYKGGEHHGDYFVLDKDITIDASELPSEGLVFTGHLDGFSTHTSQAYHTITLTNPGAIVPCTNEPLIKLYQDENATETIPQLYWYEEIAQSKPLTRSSIDPFVPSEDNLTKFDMSTTYPADLDGFAIYYKDEVDGDFKIYSKRTFYKKSPTYLFAGLNGVYSTRQEEASDKYNQGWKWEANVHLENGFWLPYKDTTTNTGWRAEVINLQVIGGDMFKSDAEITGNVQNCKDKNGAVENRTPAYPKYK